MPAFVRLMLASLDVFDFGELAQDTNTAAKAA